MSDISPLRFWCQKVLPLVYDDSLSYYEVVCKVAEKTNEIIQSFQTLEEGLDQTINDNVKEEVAKFEAEIKQIQSDLETQIQNTDKELSEKYNQLEQETKLQIAGLEGNIEGRFDEIRIQLDGDIANWEADFEEEFNQNYSTKINELENNYQSKLNEIENKYDDNNSQIANFLNDYEVKQEFGDSETATISQKALTNFGFSPCFNVSQISTGEPGFIISSDGTTIRSRHTLTFYLSSYKYSLTFSIDTSTTFTFTNSPSVEYPCIILDFSKILELNVSKFVPRVKQNQISFKYGPQNFIGSEGTISLGQLRFSEGNIIEYLPVRPLVFTKS